MNSVERRCVVQQCYLPRFLMWAREGWLAVAFRNSVISWDPRTCTDLVPVTSLGFTLAGVIWGRVEKARNKVNY
jgi:hypothetical protein